MEEDRMSTIHQHRDTAVAASIPWTLHALADHVTNQDLPAPASIDIPGHYIGEDATPAVLIVLDERCTDAWIASLDQPAPVIHTDHASGTWHDVHGIANSVRVRLTWFTVGTRLAPAVLTVVDDLVDHETCANTDCGRTLCYCLGINVIGPCTGAVAPGCTHPAAFVCDEHRGDCDDCAADMAADRQNGRL
jgi:hypothetical protein